MPIIPGATGLVIIMLPFGFLYSFLSGYFTSRPAIKGYVRMCNAHLQACKQLEAVHNGMGANGPSSVKLR